MQAFSKVLITGNLLRINPKFPHRSNQNGNIRWLHELLKPILQPLLGMDVAADYYAPGSRFNAAKIYECEAAPMLREGLAQLFDAAPSGQVLEYARPLFADSMVVGFELPNYMERLLGVLKVPYVNAVLGPLRFLPDLSVAMRTNVPEWQAAIEAHALEERAIKFYAGAMKARLARMPPLKIQAGTAIIAGQVSDDVSLISEGRYKSLADHTEALADIFARYPRVAFKPHPYADKQQVDEQIGLLKKLGRLEVRHDNIYRLMASERVPVVCALNSSVTYEAQFLGCNGRALMAPRFPVRLKSQMDREAFTQTLGHVTTPEFWAKMLGVQCNLPEVRHPVGVLRQSLGMDWGLADPPAQDGWEALMRRSAHLLKGAVRKLYR